MVRAVRTRNNASSADTIRSGADPSSASEIVCVTRIFLNPRQSRCPSLGQYALGRLSLSQHALVWSDEVWHLHETSGGAAEGIPSRLPSGLPI